MSDQYKWEIKICACEVCILFLSDLCSVDPEIDTLVIKTAGYFVLNNIFYIIS